MQCAGDACARVKCGHYHAALFFDAQSLTGFYEQYYSIGQRKNRKDVSSK